MSRHVHADLMAEYAKDAQTTDTPWAGWEFNTGKSPNWYSFGSNPIWATDTEYRRKRKTHIVNGKEVAAPLDEIEIGQTIWFLHSFTCTDSKLIRNPHNWINEINRGVLFATKEDAKENFDAHFPIRNI